MSLKFFVLNGDTLGLLCKFCANSIYLTMFCLEEKGYPSRHLACMKKKKVYLSLFNINIRGNAQKASSYHSID